MESSSVSSPSNLSNTGFSERKRDSEIPISDVEGSSSKKPKIFYRDPRINFPDPDRRFTYSNSGGQNVKDNEPNLSRTDKEEPSVKAKYCEDYFSDGGCKNYMCRFAHGDCEINEPFYIPPKDAIVFCPIYGNKNKIKSSFGAFGPPFFSAYMFPYIEPSHIGLVFGKRGEIFQWICNLTGVKITVENNKKVPGLKKIVVSGGFRKCYDVITIVQALLGNFVSFAERGQIPPVHDYKTQLCKNYAKGSCKHDAEKCWFAHGDSELRPSSVQIVKNVLKAKEDRKNMIMRSQKSDELKEGSDCG